MWRPQPDSPAGERRPADGDTPPEPIVLAFHKLSPRLSFGVTNISPRRFDRLLQRLCNAGFDPSLPSSEEPASSSIPLFVSFDDGYAHLLQHLQSLIEKYRFKPIIFVPTAWIGKQNRWDYSSRVRPERHLNRVEIKWLSEIGVAFGSHGHRHIDLTRCDTWPLAEELTASRRILEDITGREVTAISYPFGRCNATVAAAAEQAGYTAGYTMRFPEATDQPLCRGRVPVYGYDTPRSVLWKLRSGPMRRVERWKAAVTNQLSTGTIWLNRMRGLG